ncbi:transmembrane protease serine 5 isoform X2 [Xenopus laevis]|uniref:Transmembrane protease serine 5 isoform X2 n=1 Tax=Xenopus laevis TaxID=8355 RepID=A0A8J0T2F1_XENLA|nr:transmembrane protease serine 5 isoform X2 [Xenopus laevis]
MKTSVEAGKSKSCCLGVQKNMAILFTLVVLSGTAVGIYIIVEYFMTPLVSHDTVPLQDPDATTQCNDTDNEATATAPRKVSFRINTKNCLLEVLVKGKQEWLLMCHERWNSTWGTLICRHLGYIRLLHHRAVHLTDVKLNHSQEFVQVPLTGDTGTEHVWKSRRGCLSGHIVALKCSECGSRSKSPRIIGGSDVGLGRWPWQVSLYRDNKHVCGGSVVATQWIITAAHCVHNYRSFQPSSWTILSGIINHASTNPLASTSAVKKIIYHQKYDGRSHDYDVALVKLVKPLNYSDNMRPVCLPQYDQEFPVGTECWVTGWGHTHPDSIHMSESLKEALVPLISTRKCNSSCVYGGDITPRMICAGYLEGKVDACQGDSGGPLVCQTDYTWRLAGVVSWGMGCAEPNRPGVYTKIASFLDWIYQMIEDQ